MDRALAVLLISTLSTTGLLALWAATSQRHWFVRTAGYLAAIAPLLLIPAYEPFIALALLGAVVTAGVLLARRIARAKQDGASPSATEVRAAPRFSLATLLLAMVLCGAAAAIASRAPALNRYAWRSVVIFGVCGGIATLLGAGAASRRWTRVFAAAGLAAIAAMVVSVAPAWLDWFAPAMLGFGGWPPTPPDPSDPFSGILFSDERPVALWMVVLPAVVVATLLAALLARIAVSRERRRGARRIAAAMAAFVVVLIAVPAVGALCRLLLPEPIPVTRLPQPNGYDVVVAAGRTLENALVNSWAFDQETATRAELSKAANEVAQAIRDARQAFQLEFLTPVDFSTEESLPIEDMGHLRGLARAFSVTGRLAAVDGERDRALNAYLDAVRLGIECRRGGLIVSGLVGAAITGVGHRGLYEIHDHLTPSQCQAAMEQLQALLAAREPYETLEWRDRIWTQHAMGWIGRLYQILEDVGGRSPLVQSVMPVYAEGYSGPFVMEAARTRLLIAHLTLRAYMAEHDAAPESWQQVEEVGFAPLPVDPWDPVGGLLRYQLSDAGPVLYSVGPNGVDDGGLSKDKENPGYPLTGDFRMDAAVAE